MMASWRSLILWSVAALVVAATAVSFVLWGTHGAAYLIDMVETYCL
ncbi:MAG: hypothetical protein JSR91_13425 [Proteobacteria bacterium]|nr:hypothetical protein [Pseudomonadota bacterium]